MHLQGEMLSGGGDEGAEGEEAAGHNCKLTSTFQYFIQIGSQH